MSWLKEKVFENLTEENIAEIADLDSKGLLIAPGENIDQYKERLSTLCKRTNELEDELRQNGKFDLFGLILERDHRIGTNIMREAAEITEKYYKFAINWVPGFFLSQSIGPLWGGCAISFPEDFFSIFLIRSNFKKQEKWLFIYSRQELLSHELCHIARMPIKDRLFEEHFAYQASTSWFRRCFGNCFQRQIDALLFLFPVLILLAVQMFNSFNLLNNYFSFDLPSLPFWILAGCYPAFLLYRNSLYRKYAFQAEVNLQAAGIEDAQPILFRCSKDEIIRMAILTDPEKLKSWINDCVQKDLHWKVIKYRFISKSPEANGYCISETTGEPPKLHRK